MRKLATIILVATLLVGGGLFLFNPPDEETTGASGPVRSSEEKANSEPAVPGGVILRKISTAEIVAIKSSEDARDIFEQLAHRLMMELDELRETTHLAEIRSRLTPTANQYYLLDRAGKAAGLEQADFQKLSPDQADRVAALIELWTANQLLGEEADRIYANLGILESEHLPFMLRKALAP